MSNFAQLIDVTEFGVAANYLRQADSGIDYLLHTKTEALLPRLAERLSADLCGRTLGRGQFYDYIKNLMAELDLRISARQHLPRIEASSQISLGDIPRLAASRVIYLAPFYLAHTPGLFEGKLIRPKPELPPTAKQGVGTKI